MLIQPLTPEILEKRRVLRRKILGWPGRVWRKTRRGIFWTLAVGFVLHLGLNIYASALLNRELAEIRQKGEPLQFSEMAPPSVPDAQNAALLYARATKTLSFTPQERTSMGTRDDRISPEDNRVIQAALNKNRAALDLVRRAALMPKCVFPLDYQSDPFSVTVPYYAEMRELARLLGAAARIEAQKGDREGALRDVRAVFGMTRHLSNEPFLIGFLVARAIDAVANNSLSQVLQSVPLTPAQAREFNASLPRTDWNRAFTHVMVGERVFEIAVFNKITHTKSGNILRDMGVEPAPLWGSYPLLLLYRPVLKLDEVQTLRLWKPILASAAAPPFSKQANYEDRIMQDTPFYAILTRILMPVFSRANVNRDRAEVHLRQREIALQIAVFRTARQRYPTSLGEVSALNGKSLPLDPYSRKPFIYRLEKGAREFKLYSIGPDLRDDGGSNQSYQLKSGSWISGDDILWGGPKRSTY